ncbi:MAG: GxGYxYP family putative glycoside hydrolase [Capsulimonadales bacterium]|nr:GxGYxYP family putative glycoside hydrolase [Capsulimonadales bacterium]
MLTLPRELHVLPHEGLSPAEQSLALTLQGLRNAKGPTVLLRTGPGSFGRILEAELRRKGVRFIEAATVWELLGRFRESVAGGVRFRLGTPSVNVATTLCGPLTAVAVEDSLVERFEREGFRIVRDVRDWDDRRALKEFGNRRTQGMAVEQVIDKPGHLRDFAVAHHAFTFAAGKDHAFRQEVARTCGPNALVYGWGPDEFEWVRDLSRANATGVPADWALNLSLYEKLPAPPLRRPGRPALPDEDNVHYLAFVLSDGDNIQWLTGGFVDDTKYWAGSLRGTFPMTWEVAPILATVAPQVLAHLYATARPTDGFVTGAGLLGYTYPHFQPDRVALARQAEPFLTKADLPFISVLNANEGNPEDVAALLALKNVDGCLYKDYAPYHRQKGRITWLHGKPCIAYRGLLWDGLMSPEEAARMVSELPRRPMRDPDSYTVINVHAWSYGSSGGPLDAVRRTIERLPPEVRIVTADQILTALRRRFGGRPRVS